MTYAELVERISDVKNIPKAMVDAVLKTFAYQVETQTRMDRNVAIPGFGRFSKKTSKARKMYVPVSIGSGVPKLVDVPAKSVIKFKPFNKL